MRRIIFPVSLLFLLSFQVGAQTVDEIIAKNVEAKGGMKKLKAIKTFKASGTFVAQGGMIEADFHSYQKRPNMQRLDAIVQGQNMVQAYDGETAWWIFPFMGSLDPVLMPEDQAKPFIEGSDFDGPLVDYKEKGNKVELIGKEDMEGTEVYKLKVTLKDESIQYYYLDSEYYIELKMTSKRTAQGNEQEVDSYYSDYKEVAGVMIPHSMEQKVGGAVTARITITKIETNVDIEDSFFKMPEKEK